MSSGKTPWKAWHEVVKLREDVRTGELAMNEFAADLYDVVLQSGKRRTYEDPKEFFALTYPTTNLRDLCKDVVLRLAGKNQKAIRQLELTYGGGKTHTLITLYHLVNDPAKLPDLPSVKEFQAHIGMTPPRARVAVLPFDKLDVEKGMEVLGPTGKKRRLRQPWSVLAWQIAGSAGIKLLNADDKDEERDSAPAEPLLVELLKAPEKDGLATLVLIDEVLMYAREKVGMDPAWRDRLVNFFQYLTQAVTKVDRCAIVASLLATDPKKSDELGKAMQDELYAIFRREREEGVQPVLKEDVAEVLRRRFFTPESIQDKEAFRQAVFAGLKGIIDLDDETKKGQKKAEERYIASYPFHPDLTEVLYSKWTQLEGFQRTRGVLRTFALALRDSEKWDQSPLVGPNVFLHDAGRDGISEASRELTSVATSEVYEGKRQEWTAILQTELAKARETQDDYPGLKHREIEQAVFATFLHSQPIGAKALLRDLLVLIGATRPDKIELEKALRQWFDRSWFLDESADAEVKPTNGTKPLPISWRLGSKPNLRQMHADACTRVPDELVEMRLIEDIRKLKSLTAGASGAGAKVHLLPDKPAQIEDDGDFHYAVLGPNFACESGKPAAARHFIEETTSAERPRKERNAVVLAVPSRDGLVGVKTAIKEYLGWETVRDTLKRQGQELDPIRQAMLQGYIDASNKRIPGTLQQAYCIVVTVNEKDEVQAFKIQVGDDPLFQTIKGDKRSRIQDTAISADAILPGGPYDLWRDDEDARRVKDLVGAFARFARLPKMLNRKAILDTIVAGCAEGVFVGKLTRPDKSIRTFWRQRLDEGVLDDSGLELVLPERAELTELAPAMVYPQAIKELWDAPELTLKRVHDFFSGGRTMKVSRGGYEEPIAVPRVAAPIVDSAVTAAIRDGKLWLTSGPASFLAEEVPAGLLGDDAVVQAPPPPIPPLDVLPQRTPAAWTDNAATGQRLAVAISERIGKVMPWVTVRDAIEGALRARMIERLPDSGPWPCDYAGSPNLRLRVAVGGPVPSGPTPPAPPPSRPGTRSGVAKLQPSQIQDLADVMGELLKAKQDCEVSFNVRIDLAGKQPPSDSVISEINRVLKSVNSEFQVG
ncbi:MAG: ATP-binding protein [Planctomycetia bacterium]|nr:MAG: ATP-binding protein [Planctomycetia bacterium]